MVNRVTSWTWGVVCRSKAAPGGWSTGSQAGSGVQETESQVGLGSWPRWPHAGSGVWTIGSQAGPGRWSTGTEAWQGGWAIGSQVGPGDRVVGSQAEPRLGLGMADNNAQKTTLLGQWEGRRNSTSIFPLSPSQQSGPVYCHGCSQWGTVFSMTPPAG